jgi:hypothetical protein
LTFETGGVSLPAHTPRGGGGTLILPIAPILLILLWRRRLYGQRRLDAITN